MLSNITYKSAACAQLYMHEQLQGFAQTHPRAAVLATFPVCILDVAAETVKHPIAAIENIAFSAINVGGSSCFKECSLSDASRSIKTAGITLGATAIMSIISPFNLLARLLVNLSDPESAHSCNIEADEQANLPAIAYDSNERKGLLAAVSNKEESVIIEKLLAANNILTHQSIGRALEDAVENGHIDAVPTLLTDSRLTKQSIGRALKKAAENNRSEIMPLLIGGLIKLVLAKYNQDELSPLEIKEFQKDNLFINACLSKAKKIATSNGYSKIINHLNETAKELKM